MRILKTKTGTTKVTLTMRNEEMATLRKLILKKIKVNY